MVTTRGWIQIIKGSDGYAVYTWSHSRDSGTMHAQGMSLRDALALVVDLKDHNPGFQIDIDIREGENG